MIVELIIAYGLLAQYSKVKRATARKTFDKVQRPVCLGITGVMKTGSTAASEVTDLTTTLLIFTNSLSLFYY